MRMLSSLMLCAGVLVGTSGCVVAPLPPPRPAVVVPATVYVAPTYASPGPGWVWMHHPTYGWGWRHPEHGWHQGWR